MNNAEIVETRFVPFPCCAAAPPLSKVVVNMFSLSIVVGTASGVFAVVDVPETLVLWLLTMILMLMKVGNSRTTTVCVNDSSGFRLSVLVATVVISLLVMIMTAAISKDFPKVDLEMEKWQILYLIKLKIFSIAPETVNVTSNFAAKCNGLFE